MITTRYARAVSIRAQPARVPPSLRSGFDQQLRYVIDLRGVPEWFATDNVHGSIGSAAGRFSSRVASAQVVHIQRKSA